MAALTLTGPVEVDIDAAGAATLMMRRSGHANALTADMVDALLGAVHEAARRQCTSLVVRSGEQQFCGGFDLAGLDEATSAELTHRFLRIGLLLETLATAPMLTIAVVDGAAVGAGADIVAACDVRVGSSRSRFRFPGSAFGVVLGARRLASLVGAGRAVTLAATGRTLDAGTALSWGLLDAVVEQPELDEHVNAAQRSARDRAPGVLAALRAAATGDDPAGMGELARSLARIPDLRTAIKTYAQPQRERT